MSERPTDAQVAEWREKWREAYDGTNGGKEAALVRLSRLCLRVLDELVAERKCADAAEAKLSAVRKIIADADNSTEVREPDYWELLDQFRVLLDGQEGSDG